MSKPASTAISDNGAGEDQLRKREEISALAQTLKKMFHTVQGRFALAVEREDTDAATRLFDKLEYVRGRLGSENASMVEGLLIDRVTLCLGRLWYVEDQVSWTYGRGVSIDVAEHWDKRLTTAQNRFLKACAALDRHRLLTGGPRPAFDAVGYLESEPRQITGD